MTEEILFSADTPPLPWSELVPYRLSYGSKGAGLLSLPRPWVPPFALIPANFISGGKRDAAEITQLPAGILKRFFDLAGESRRLIVRSSVVGESIWERGTYKSLDIILEPKGYIEQLRLAAEQVLASATGREVGLVLQAFIKPWMRGELGNLLRISKTRDHWELSTVGVDDVPARMRFNSQRDVAASNDRALVTKTQRERTFSSVSAWLNNELLRGRRERLNVEWIADYNYIYLVQIDEEDEDPFGINPFQLRVPSTFTPVTATGSFLAAADEASIKQWDKLRVLEELWEAETKHKPVLFYLPFSTLSSSRDSAKKIALLAKDFEELIGPDSIIVRTSVRAGIDKAVNLPRTECLGPDEAARWCLEKRKELLAEGHSEADLAFVAHRFIGARASAWVRADPANPLVEIHSLWGLPDALQYCPYDIWEVHLPTEVATDYPDYKSNILIPRDHGGWDYVRVKNELARSLSVTRKDAIELASRTAAIAKKLGRPCHVMWFVGCVDDAGNIFSIPWYWTEAHEPEKNTDRANYQVFLVRDNETLESFKNFTGSRVRQAVELRPTELGLMRDNKFIDAVGKAAREFGVPVILNGSTLAHAYYQLRKLECVVVTRGEKDHQRIRNQHQFGKLVRDKIPARIAQRREADITKKVPTTLIKGFLTSKLIEEALEVRDALGDVQKTVELADLFEVLRGLCHAEGINIDAVMRAADEKRQKAGGFEDGLVLLQTGILGRDKNTLAGAEKKSTQVLGRHVANDTYEIPFSFFGFMELDQPRSLAFSDFGVRLAITLKADRFEIHISKGGEQLDLPLDLAFDPDE